VLRRLRLRSLSGYALGVLAGSLVFGGWAFASSGVQTISAQFADIGIRVGQQTIATAAEPFIYNHNVYVPISAIGHGLGATVTWSGAKHQVVVTDQQIAKVQQGALNFYNLPIYAGTHTVLYDGQTYVSGFALATVANEPFYYDAARQAIYIGQGPSSGMPISSFYDTRDYGDYAHEENGSIGPDYGFNDGAPTINGIVYPNSNSLVWAPQASGSEVPGVEYNLKNAYTTVTGAFGIDDASNTRQQAQLTLMSGTSVLYQSPWMSHGEPATPVSANLTGVQLLTIEFSIKTSSGQVYSMGQAVPAGMNVDVDFVDVNLH